MTFEEYLIDYHLRYCNKKDYFDWINSLTVDDWLKFGNAFGDERSIDWR